MTERKQADKALQESEKKYRSLFENMLDGSAYCKMLYDDQSLPIDFVYLDVNSAFERLTGLKDVTGKRATQAIPGIKEAHPELFNTYNRVASTGKPEKFEIKFKPLGIWLSISVYSTEKGYFVAVFDNITGRKRAEEALRESQEQYRGVVENTSAIILRLDPRGVITFANRRALEFFGYAADELIGKHAIGTIVPPQETTGRDLAAMVDEIALNPDCFHSNANENICKDGRRVWMEWTNSGIYDGNGKLKEFLSVGIDATGRKQAEEALRRSKDELEQKVQERTAELLKSKEAAEAAVEAKAAFMANMSHELRTPMNSVIGFTGLLLEDEKLTEEQKDYLESIRNSGQSLIMLINEVLDFSKMDREKMDLELQTFDLRNIMEEALDMVAAQAANKGLELNYAFDKNVPEAIIGDPGKLRQVLSNLLSNAVKFTNEGEVEVNVSSDPDQEEIHFTVRDTGIGISEEDIGKLFHPFSQLDLSYSRGFEGTGLGLAISKKLVELMGGKIRVESEVGIGSTFHFTIPADTAPAKHKPFLTGSFEGKRVLIVEDNQTLRRILGRQLHTWGIVPMMASGIYEAVGLLQRDDNFDAVIIDASKDDALSMIAGKRDWWKQLPFIALTSLGQKVPPDLFQAVLTKPLKPAKLFNALKDVLVKREASGPVEVSEMEKSYGPLRILLAEDNLSNQKVTLEMLKKLGYRADAVVNGQEVLEALERQPYDIIFMDVKMPIMNGIQAAMKIREHWPENGPKIIAVTAYALHGDKETCLTAGMDGYIAKPVQKEDLAEVLKRCALNAQ